MESYTVLIPAVILLASGFLVIFGSRLLSISPIVGFLLTGVLLGPSMLNVLQENDVTSLLAKLGVAFLLFDIGLHFSMKSVWSLRKEIFGIGALQLFLSGLVLAVGTSFAFYGTVDIALLIGLSLALSSTAVVMQILADLKQSESPVGKAAKSVLIFQDIAAVFLLILADALGGDFPLWAIILEALAKTGIAVLSAVVLGQVVLTPLMRTMIRYDDPEMFTIFGLLVVMITGLATAYAGLSMTLGAFLAGMVLAETPFRVLLQTELRPFRSLLVALFFITIGMMINPGQIIAEFSSVLWLLMFILVCKGVIIAGIVRLFRRPMYQSIQLGALLAQGSEFAFVIFSYDNVERVLGVDVAQQLIAAIALSMLLTPFLCMLANKLSLKLCDTLKNMIVNCPSGTASPVSQQPVFIVGMSEFGKTVARALDTQQIPYIAVDHDRARFLEAIAAGYVVAYGQTSDLRFWNMLGVRHVRAMVFTTLRYEIAKDIAPVVKKIYPDVRRYVAVKDSGEGVKFARLGLTPMSNHGSPPGLEMASLLLEELGVERKKIEVWSREEQSSWLETHLGYPEELITAAAE